MTKSARFLARTALAASLCSLGGVAAAQDAASVAKVPGGNASAVGAASPDAPAQAADQSSEIGLGDIVVTAQRREQRLDRVGVSVSAFSADQLASLGMRSAAEITAHVPGIVMESTAGGSLNASLVVRGVAATDFAANQESPNAIYVDDVYVSSPYEANFVFYDLARVELLRGPQGTLFGRNSTGGLVNYITAKPGDRLDGYIDAIYGSFNQVRVEGAVGGPLSDHVRARLSGAIDTSDGWWRNNTGSDTFSQRYWGLRGQLEADLTPGLEALLTLQYDRSPRMRAGTYDAQPTYIDPATGRPALQPATLDAHGTGPGNDLLGYRDPDTDPRSSSFNDFGFLTKERISPTARLNWTINDELTATSLTNYTHFKFSYREDCDGTPINACDYPSGQTLNQWSQELRLSKTGERLNWTAGAYYLDIDQTNYQRYSFPAFSGTAFAFSDENLFDQHVKSFSIFGQFDYLLTDKLRLTLGARAVHDEKTFSSTTSFSELGNFVDAFEVYSPALVIYDFSPATVGSLATEKTWAWSGRAQLDYIASDDALYYLSVARGVKAPGFNSNIAGTLTIDQTPFRGETMYAYEAGAKLKLFDRRLRLNGSAFYYDYSDFQAFQFNGLQSLVTNNDAYMYGGELEVTTSPLRGLDLMLGVSYLNTKVKDVRTSYSGILDQEAVNAPHWTLNGLIRKSFDVGSGKLALQYDANYVTRRYASVDNNPATELGAALIQNARVSYRFAGGVEAAVFVSNLANKAKQTNVFDQTVTFGTRIVNYNAPRWWGVELRKKL